MKVYIAGKITGDGNYREKFRKFAEQLSGYTGDIVLTPAELPEGMSRADYMRICFAMIDTADCVVLLPDWTDSPGARLEAEYCLYTGKRVYRMQIREDDDGPGMSLEMVR